MKLETYRQIVEECHKTNANKLDSLNEKFSGISERTLGSIISQEYQKKTKRFYHMHHSPDVTNSYYEQYLKASKTCKQPGYLLDIAEKADLSPALMARIILEKYYTKDGESVNKQQINQIMKDTTLIEDKDFAVEIYLCILNDEMYGYVSDVTKQCIGIDYENKLKNDLQILGVAFTDEDELREKGYDKTPDIKLEVPIAVDGHIINWIESKASFGDEENHKTYLKEQYWSYWNRFGPGLVIYWFGFIEELDTNQDKGILLKDHMPKNISFINPSLLIKL
ncbi:CDAN1-interacting nuclease 1 isoform X1 [Centruroides vittatus]|uniref:CDAN1-interacting nuclease 1 isoform X1 n=1 Tax=Centruroides vittatus TaxID=120091 RepID=UPI0035101D42